MITARKQAREALGRDPNAIDPYDAPARARTPLAAVTKPALVDYGPGVAVLSPGEAAARLGITRAELMAMAAAGTIKTLPTDYTPMIRSREVVRLKAPNAGFESILLGEWFAGAHRLVDPAPKAPLIA